MHRTRGSTCTIALTLITLTLTTTVFAACASSSHSSAASTSASTSFTTPATARVVPAPSSAPISTTTAPQATPAPVRVPIVGTFRASVSTLTAADLPSTYRTGCPVGPAQLRSLRLSYWGFDDRAHVGTIVVAASVTVAVIAVFRSLYEQRFPIRRMQPEDAYGGRDPASMIADNTSGFNCRNAVAPGAPKWSAHAYGTAIDVNTVENPYVEGGVVQPANGAAFVDRTRVRPGMAEPSGVLNRAFAAIGWQWGGRWRGSPDYQHFSADGG